jgi:hypothetical protein
MFLSDPLPFAVMSLEILNSSIVVDNIAVKVGLHIVRVFHHLF